MNKIIEVKNLVKKYNKASVNAVNDVSFEVNEGEFFTLLGPNGAGKTTTISILTTTLAKTSGEIMVAGYDIEKEADKVRKNIGVIFQNPSLDLNLTAEENVRFHAVLYGLFPYRLTFGMMPKEYQMAVEKLATILGIEKDIFKPIKTFSGGMKRKLEIVRGLIHKPKILFLDEPTTGLDPLSRKNLWKYLKEVMRDEGLTVFLTTHYLEEAEGSDRICIIDDGKVAKMGTPAEIKKELIGNLGDETRNKKLEEELEKISLKYKTKVRIDTPTLEEAYLEIISKNNNA